MKKYVSLLLGALIFLVLLMSCSDSQNDNSTNSSDCKHEYKNQLDTICDLCGYERAKPEFPTDSPCEHMWVQNDAEQCEHLEVCILCGEKRGEDVLHIYFDENGNPLEKCLNCGNPNNQYIPNE